MPTKNRPLLNVLAYSDFRNWLNRLADAGDIAGKTGGSSDQSDPVGRYLKEEKGWHGYVGRFEFFRDGRTTEGSIYKLPGWAVEFQMRMNGMNNLDVEEDGVTQLISAEDCLEIMGGLM